MAIAAFAAVAMPCSADVIEISSNGAVTYAAPAVFTSTRVEVIERVLAARPVGQAIDLGRAIADAAARNRIDAHLITAVAWQESRFHQSAISNRGAVGVMQLTAAAAHDVGVDRFNAGQNVLGGATYLRRMMDRYGGDLRLTLAAYNAGPAAVDRYRDVPPYAETRAYVSAILARMPPLSAIAAPSLLIDR